VEVNIVIQFHFASGLFTIQSLRLQTMTCSYKAVTVQ